MGSRALRRLGINLLIAIASVGLTLIALDLILRRFYFPTDSPFNYRVPDPVLGWHLEPDSRYTNENWEFSVQVTYNSKGWRDVEHNYKKPESVFRIVVLGDSFMEAYSVEFEESFARRLEGFLKDSGRRRVEVINLGVGGYGTLQEYLAFAEEGIRYRPDLVLVGFYVANDVQNNSFDLESQVSGGIKVRSRPFLEPGGPDDWEITLVDYDGARQRYAQEKMERENELEAFWRERSAILLLLEETLERQGVGGDGSQALPAGSDVWVHACAESPEYTAGWAITGRILARLKRDVEAAGAELVVFTVPAWQEVDPGYMNRVLKATGHPEDYCLPQAPGYDRLAGLLAGQGIVYVDLRPAFQEAEGQADRELFRWSDRHWNAEGNFLAAWEVYRTLDGGGLLP